MRRVCFSATAEPDPAWWGVKSVTEHAKAVGQEQCWAPSVDWAIFQEVRHVRRVCFLAAAEPDSAWW